MEQTSKPYRWSFAVSADTIDDLGHANNAAYLGWVQKAITSMWSERARAVDIDRVAWIALRHEVDYRRPAFEGDLLAAFVSIQAWAGARATFVTRIERGSALVAEARSILCCVDAEGLRPVRITGGIAAPFYE